MTRLITVVLEGEQGTEDVTLVEAEFQSGDKTGTSSLAELIPLPGGGKLALSCAWSPSNNNLSVSLGREGAEPEQLLAMCNWDRVAPYFSLFIAGAGRISLFFKSGMQSQDVGSPDYMMGKTIVHGVEIESDEPGVGDVASRGKTVVLLISGSLRRGDVFMDRERHSFRIGERVVIAGLEYGVEGMRVGGHRQIRVPPHLGYRETGVPGKIPSNALLFFDLELLEVRD